MPNQSAIPDIYYSIFAFFEPFLCIAGFIGTFYDPETVSLLAIEYNGSLTDRIFWL